MTRVRRVLIFPCTDTFSHVGRALALTDWLEAVGFEVHIGVARPRGPWVSRFFPRCHRVCELWEPSGIPFPCISWFADGEHVERCIRSQEDVIREVRPDLIVGIFDFVSAVSCGSRPLVTLNGACMLPTYDGVLGFDGRPSRARDEQRRLFESFWVFAGRAFRRALAARDRPEVRLATELLVGDRSLVYEIPEVCGAQALPDGGSFVGPITWPGWETIGEEPPLEREEGAPTVYLNSGSLPKRGELLARLAGEALAAGARVLLSTGVGGASETAPRLFSRPLLRPVPAIRAADLVVCTGGVGSCYTNLLHGVPTLVLPTQPEQATNGINLERAGCGRVLLANRPFVGHPAEYLEALEPGQFSVVLREILEGLAPRAAAALAAIRRALRGVKTRERVVALAEELL
ncbi:MAG: hypothetical protein HZB55_15735 [Deltaproteobacteria bacterium]|nr:hypothetical protein [Deltaproteobacteria bacterium]